MATTKQLQEMVRFHLRAATAYRKVGKITEAEAAEERARACTRIIFGEARRQEATRG